MNENRMRRETRKLVINQFKYILRLSRQLASDYSTERIPLKLLDKIINEARLKSPFEDDHKLETFRVSFNNLLEAMKRECKMRSAIIGDNRVSINEIKAVTKLIRTNFITGQDATA